jgi:hypothetical protein
MVVVVKDAHDTVLYQRVIGRDGAWSELDDAYEDIDFDGDTIRISQLWGRSHVIKTSELLK